jgi:hypothetical protein
MAGGNAAVETTVPKREQSSSGKSSNKSRSSSSSSRSCNRNSCSSYSSSGNSSSTATRRATLKATGVYTDLENVKSDNAGAECPPYEHEHGKSQPVIMMVT